MFIVLLLYIYRPFLVCYFYPGGLVFVSKLVPLPDIYTNQPSLPPAPVRVLDYIWLMLVLTAKCTIDITYVVGVENINH